MEELRYPIGRLDLKEEYSVSEIKRNITKIKNFPSKFSKKAKSLSFEQLDSPYRSNGWTALQVIHHVADSHLNAYLRFKLGLTEINPEIRVYDQKAWSALSEIHETPIDVSLELIKNLHIRLTNTLKSISNEEFGKTVFHPEMQRTITLAQLLAIYAWHGEHHLAHLDLV